MAHLPLKMELMLSVSRTCEPDIFRYQVVQWYSVLNDLIMLGFPFDHFKIDHFN